jgi:DNA ligase-1
LKKKEFVEAEFKIVGFTSGEGLDADCVIWICETNGLTFNCRYGERELRKFQLKNGNVFVGKKLTVQYQGTTSNGIPRFPVGKSIRDYE